MTTNGCKPVSKRQANDAKFQRRNVGCLILSKDDEYILQLRDEDIPEYPGQVALFGGKVERGEQPFDTLVRELKEELDIIIPHLEVIRLGIVSEPETNYNNLEFLYFWHDTEGIVNHCYEGKLIFVKDIKELQQQRQVMNDVFWATEKQKLIIGSD